MDEVKREELITEMERKGHERMATFVQKDCYTREELIEVTDAIECNIPHNTHRFCKWLAVEFEGEEYWPKFQFDKQGQTPEGFDVVNAVLSHKGHTGISVYNFWQDVPIDKNPEEKTNFDLLREGKIMYVAHHALYIFMEQGGR